MKIFLIFGAFLPFFVMISACKTKNLDPPTTSDPGGDTENYPAWPTKKPKGQIDFSKHIKPMLETHCLQCHNAQEAKKNAGLNLETLAKAQSTGRSGAIIIPGNAKGSLLYQVLVLDVSHPTAMPPSPDKFWGVRLEMIQDWIDQGANWPASVVLQRP